MISQDRQVRVDYERRRMAHHDAVSLRRDSWLEGQHAALVKSLTAVLRARGFSLSDTLRARIDAETELTRLKGWVARAAVTPSVEALLDG